ncbi:MAG: hypothetical protein ACLRWQ_15505 [Flavonifractor plautii]
MDQITNQRRTRGAHCPGTDAQTVKYLLLLLGHPLFGVSADYVVRLLPTTPLLSCLCTKLHPGIINLRGQIISP